jgi:phosphate transport system permease protein
MSKGEYEAAYGIALVLLVIVLVINMATKLLAKKFDVNRR